MAYYEKLVGKKVVFLEDFDIFKSGEEAIIVKKDGGNFLLYSEKNEIGHNASHRVDKQRFKNEYGSWYINREYVEDGVFMKIKNFRWGE